MNIQQYYQQTAHESLNASIASLVPVVIFILIGPFLPSKLIVFFFSIPFLFYSLVCYQNFSLNKMRAEKIIGQAIKAQKQSLFEHSELLIGFLPAPSLRMVFFESGGNVVGEIKDLKFKGYRWILPKLIDKNISKKYGLYHGNGHLTSIIAMEKNKIAWRNCTGELIEEIYLLNSGSKLQHWSYKEKQLFAHIELLHTDMKIKDQHKRELARLRKGWMPVEWGQHFKDANTPILTFANGLTKEEKAVIFSIIAKQFCYWEH